MLNKILLIFLFFLQIFLQHFEEKYIQSDETKKKHKNVFMQKSLYYKWRSDKFKTYTLICGETMVRQNNFKF